METINKLYIFNIQIIISSEKTWLNLNHVTVHSSTLLYIFKLQEQLLKIEKLHNKQTRSKHKKVQRNAYGSAL